jgi:hypothetical protein
MRILILASLLASFSAFAGPSELDRDITIRSSAELAGTVILREDLSTGEMAVFETTADYEKGQLEALAQVSSFEKLASDRIIDELDQEVGVSSWYWFGGYGYGYNWGYGYYYSNYWYSPYYYWATPRYRYWCY